MKKYYIPTSTLNFNNILSTESISPKLFYEKRGFGYSRWTSVYKNDDVNYATLLFDVPHVFKRKESNVEDHPMLIEIETDEIFSSLPNGIYFTNKTIYLNPWQTKFHFFSEDVKKIVESMSGSSLETKLVRLYKEGLCVSNFDGAYPNVDFNALEKPSQQDIDKYIEEDYRINKMKGLLYGYYIGANISSQKDLIKELASLKEIYNIFSSVISDQDRKPSKEQSNRLNELFDFWQSQQSLLQELKRACKESELPDEQLNVLCSKIKNILRAHRRIKRIDDLTSNPDYAINWVKQEIEKLNDKIANNRTLLKPDDNEIITIDKTLSEVAIQDSQMGKLFCFWINNVLSSRSFNGKISSVKEELSDAITSAAKDVIGESEWGNSSVRTYLNKLRHHLRGKEFDQSWDNGVLSSIAAVLIKGDDWKQLLDFMQSREMFDYRLAYAIYGVLNGFANMTRDFTDILLNKNKEDDYLSTVYFSIYEQLHGKNLRSLIPESNNRVQSKSNDNHITEQWREIGMKILSDNYYKQEKYIKYRECFENALNANGTNTDARRFLKILSSYVNKNAKLYQELKKELETGRCDDRAVIKQRNDNSRCLELSFGDSQDKKVSQCNSLQYSSPYSISQNKSYNSMLKDKRWIDECVSLFIKDDSEAQKQFKEDMEWFVDNHSEKVWNNNKKHYEKGCYYRKGISNRAVLDNLNKYLPNRLNQEEWVKKQYERIPIPKVLEYLENRYGK